MTEERGPGTPAVTPAAGSLLPAADGTGPLAIVVMGVSGSGKSSIGRALAAAANYDFVDADDLHPAANVAKMRGGTPLTDEDRWPWLEAVVEAMTQRLKADTGIVVACSALKLTYRDLLRSAGNGVRFVHLHGSEKLIGTRLARRSGHFFKPRLLASQFAALETPDPGVETDVTVVDAGAKRATLINTITKALGLAD